MIADRPGLASIIVGAAALLGLVCPPEPADAGPPGLSPLYSGAVLFDSSGAPVVTVGLLSRQSQVRLPLPAGTVVIAGTAEHRLASACELTATVSDARTGRTVWHLVAAEGGPNDPPGAGGAEEWTGRGYRPVTIETGQVFSVHGTLVDNRRRLLSLGTFETEAAADKAALDVERRFGTLPQPMATLAALPAGTIVARCASPGLPARIAVPGLLWLRPPAGAMIAVPGVEYGRLGGNGRAEQIRVRGAVYLAIDPAGLLAVGNALDLESLLRGVVPAEIFPEAPGAALEAQAIAARTYTLSMAGRTHLTDPFHLCAAEHCQVYRGVLREHPATDRAIAATAGRVLFHDGRLAQTLFHASCGGHTEHNENVWAAGPAPELRGMADGEDPAGGRVTDPARFLANPPPAFCGSGRHNRELFRWERRLSGDDLFRLLDPVFGCGRLAGIRINERGVSGRAIAVTLSGSRGEAVVRGDLAIRRAFGWLPSSLFVVSARQAGDGSLAEAVFTGGGWGHGVGMCQTGAIARAGRGATAAGILAAYYTGSRIVRLYAEETD